jgi:dehydrogenase/reductase SDR family protein 1
MAADEPGRRVAWVTGASRGVGRGVAVALGQAGWVVYVTARSSAAGRTGHLPGTVEQTAEAVTAGGGHGVAMPCDHRDDEAVRTIAGRIEADHAMFGGGVRAHYVATAVCAPLLIATRHSLVATVSVAVPETEQHSFGAAYAMAKTADDRLALAAAIQLGEHGVASVAVHPGWVRTEGVLQFAEQVDLSASQSPEGVGRAIAALAGDPELMSLTGQALAVETLAARYGVDVSA